MGLFQKGTLNLLSSTQNGCHFAGDAFKCIFVDENVRISIEISLKFVLKGLINNIPALAQIMAWCRPGDKPLSDQWSLDYWQLYVSLGLNELTHLPLGDEIVVLNKWFLNS